MKILITHFKIQDFGGIINYSEVLAKGFKDLGHGVDSIMFKNKGRTGFPKVKDRSADEHNGWEWGTGLGLWMHQKTGWQGMYELNYTTDIGEWEYKVKEYDLIVHAISVPTATKQTKLDSDWIELYDHKTPQVCIIHDGNIQKLYPHIHFIKEKLMGLVCVHDSAFNSCEVMEINRMLIPNPHNIPDEQVHIMPMCERSNNVISVQTFKRCKRADKFVRMVPHLKYGHHAVLCGTGIEYHYMNSKDKVKADYLEPDGSRIWENAIKAGMEYRGVVNSANRDSLFATSKLFLDFSFSKSHNSHGSVFNRTMIEAMIQGCVPVMSDLTMQGNSLFKERINYVSIPFDASAEEHGEFINNLMKDEELLDNITTNNLELLYQFERSIIAQKIINLGMGKDIDKTSFGFATDKFKNDATRKLTHFTGI